jgi:hypothetical protein
VAFRRCYQGCYSARSCTPDELQSLKHGPFRQDQIFRVLRIAINARLPRQHATVETAGLFLVPGFSPGSTLSFGGSFPYDYQFTDQ